MTNENDEQLPAQANDQTIDVAVPPKPGYHALLSKY